jgi:signal transduction histidine kinase
MNLLTEHELAAGWKSQLEHSDRLSTLGTAVAKTAHEVCNPLTFMALTLPRLRDTLPYVGEMMTATTRAELSEMLGDIEEGLDRLQSLANDLKGYAGRRTDEPSVIELNDVARSALRLLRCVLSDRVRVEQVHSPCPPVLASRGRLVQVVLNLVRNALEALPERGAGNRVRISTGTTERGAAYVRVEDNGPGIPAALLPRIFEPFFTTKGDSGGTGLGLAISREIARDSGGTLEVRSGPDGTTFELVLPGADDARCRDRERALPSAPLSP